MMAVSSSALVRHFRIVRLSHRPTFYVCAILASLFPARMAGQDMKDVETQLSALAEQNRLLKAQVAAQQEAIEVLEKRVAELGQAPGPSQTPEPAAEKETAQAPPVVTSPSAGGLGVRISGEGGVAYFLSGRDGAYPNGEFRWDDAKIFVDASVWNDVYFFSELDLITREAIDNDVHFGEMYVDFENVSALWNQDRLLNVRVGRFYIPFGEEYQVRGVMENPLITHSESDIWGWDQGLEVYGQLGKASYALAVMDGGDSTLNTAHDDRSVAGRIGYDPGGGLHLSASAMTTGRLSSSGDTISALWFDNGFFRSLAPATSQSYFSAYLEEVDAVYRWKGGEATAAGGLVQFQDTGTGSSSTRDMSYFYLEAMQHLSDRLYGAVRFSEVLAPGGYPLAGDGVRGEYFFGNVLTTDLYRLSLGAGYRFSPPVEFKVDFSPEWGRTTTDGGRDREDYFSTELGVKF
jgi:hypothetical protein